ncbi:hypothetical protein [Bradyrhizobium sp. AUGA SZCCT0182]|uniref:hypothetical protein n=1 Tax=Bradyrhizobium sp. AUGA SZCCT0182 TaxID=2807667 RepID=UPI001BA603C5|nr:hypothetical protein [Bradyrhizobium sp. AUGA SZCCT0182]MBR1231635.1 hypothetical protein [Bradyrhizobium sp. AUGA SZCCT0182]
MRILIAAIGLAFMFLSGYVASFYYPGGFGYAQATKDVPGNPWNIVLLAVLMIAGIFSSFVFEKAKQGEGMVAVGPALRSIFNDFQFIAALFVSPLIFNSVYALTNQNPESMGDFLLAYQNGFFWQTVLAGIAGKVGGNKKATRPAQPRRATKAN